MAQVPWPDVIDAYAKGVTAVGGVVIAGSWTMYRFLRNDPYLPCVNSQVDAELRERDHDDLISFAVSIQHVGGGRLNIDQGNQHEHPKPELRVDRLLEVNGGLQREPVTKCHVLESSTTMASGESCRQCGLLALGPRLVHTVAYDVTFAFSGRRPSRALRKDGEWDFEDNVVLLVEP